MFWFGCLDADGSLQIALGRLLLLRIKHWSQNALNPISSEKVPKILDPSCLWNLHRPSLPLALQHTRRKKKGQPTSSLHQRNQIRIEGLERRSQLWHSWKSHEIPTSVWGPAAFLMAPCAPTWKFLTGPGSPSFTHVHPTNSLPHATATATSFARSLPSNYWVGSKGKRASVGFGKSNSQAPCSSIKNLQSKVRSPTPPFFRRRASPSSLARATGNLNSPCSCDNDQKIRWACIQPAPDS